MMTLSVLNYVDNMKCREKSNLHLSFDIKRINAINGHIQYAGAKFISAELASEALGLNSDWQCRLYLVNGNKKPAINTYRQSQWWRQEYHWWNNNMTLLHFTPSNFSMNTTPAAYYQIDSC